MLFTKSHFGRLVFDNDLNRTPIANTRLEAVEWWGILDPKAKAECLKEHGIDKPIQSINWNDLEYMYRSKHEVS